MLPKQNRLVTKYEYNKTRFLANKLGTKYSSPLFHIFYIKPHNYEGQTKVGIVVSNKFHKSAVKRNRVKRLFRETVRQNFDKITPSWWIVIHPKYQSIDKTYEEINFEFNKALQKLPIAK